MKSSIVLLGYMGCGKTKVGKKLSKKIGARFIDLDAEIEHFYSKSISQIFDDLGEIEFRKIERSILLKILDYDDFHILSLGGGTPCYFDNMELINKKTNLTFFLNLESKILAERLFSRKSTRPIIKSINNESEMLSFVNKHLFERNILEDNYSDILKIDFEKKESNQNFWFISKNKEEPRLADRYLDKGSELEQPLAIARDICKLYARISNQKNSLKIGKFLIENNDLRHVVRRAFIVEKFPYAEIQDNTIGSNLMPIDMLRLKLSFFGAVKFDPRSDKWLRINMFQGAPLPKNLKKFDDYWVYNSLN